MTRALRSALTALALLLAASSLAGCVVADDHARDAGNPASRTVGPTAARSSLVPGDDIAFIRDNHVWRAHADGTGAVQVTRGPGVDSVPAWSPDHGTIAFVHDPSPDSYPDTPTLGVVRASGGQPDFHQFEMAVQGASFAPDGRRIAVVGSIAADPYSSTEWQIERVLIFDVSSETSSVAWELHDLFAAGMSVSWSPDGGRLLLGEGMQDWEGERVGVLTLATRKLAWLKTPDSAQARWSPDGNSMLLNQQPQGFTTVLLADSTGHVRRVLVRGGGADYGVVGAKPPVFGGSYSPDGSRIVFDDASSVWVIRSDGTGKRKLLPDAVSAVWSAQ